MRLCAGIPVSLRHDYLMGCLTARSAAIPFHGTLRGVRVRKTNLKLKAAPGPEPLLKLNLACGQNPVEGFKGVDCKKLPGVDHVLDLEKYPWPWRDASVEEIHVSHFVEHLTDMIPFMEECWRILIPGGKLTVIGPYYSSMRAWQDPTHKRALSEATFLYFNEGWRKSQKLDHYDIHCDFDYTYGYMMVPEWAAREESARQFAIKHYANVVNDIVVHLVKRPIA